ncbi:MAG: protein-ADP-ribose hydrolase [Clostridiales bacterium]|nr:protein-ADP-ribose hydrolase [Candidatus Crickella merdequi]
MNQNERRQYLIKELIKENADYRELKIPEDVFAQRQTLRGLMNIRMAAPVTDEFKQIQNEYLQETSRERGVVTLEDIEEKEPGIYLWQGDITRLTTGAIVNAANSGMTGCYSACHNCIDNYIHTYAGIQLRNYCQFLMDKQGHPEPAGQAKITPGFNLPATYVIHTVGPVVSGDVTTEDERLLRSCYQSCLETATANNVDSIAFCCISTGVFMFPQRRAAEIAVETVRRYLVGNEIKVVFNVFKDEDLAIYEELLGKR